MKIILNILTHGDEKIGLKVAKEIEKLNINKNNLIIHVANEKAFKLKKRFVEQDLNRSFPGKKDGNHEQKIAYKISKIIKSADVVIDIHSTKSELKDSVIVTKLDKNTKKCIEAIQPKYVLIMNATKNNALISQAKIGLAFEYGKDNDPNVLKKTIRDIKKLFYHFGILKNRYYKRKTPTQYFNVFSSVPKPRGYKIVKNIKNYNLVCKGKPFATNGKNFIIAEEKFYPILFGEKSYKNIFGFKGKKIS